MHDATGPFPRLRLAVAPGVPSLQLSALLGLQRAEEPSVRLMLFEVADDVLLEGLREGRYDVGMSLHGNSDPALKTQALWTEKVAVALPPESRLIEHPTLCLADLQKYPIYRWQAEVCSLLDEQLAFLTPVGQERILQTTSFEMMALWVRAGYGVGVSAQSRIESARRWGIGMRLLTDSPYEIVVYLQRPHADSMSISERFEERALRVAAASL